MMTDHVTAPSKPYARSSDLARDHTIQQATHEAHPSMLRPLECVEYHEVQDCSCKHEKGSKAALADRDLEVVGW